MNCPAWKAVTPAHGGYGELLQFVFAAPGAALIVKRPLAVLVGAKDELLYADRFAPLINRERPDVPVILVPGVGHMGMVTDPRALAAVAAAAR